MRITELKISNFRGIRASRLLLPQHCVLIGDNNVGKSTILEAIDLCLGPDRLSRQPPIDEHDFHLGQYLAPKVAELKKGEPDEGVEAALDVVDSAEAPAQEPPENPAIQIDVTITDLSEEQQDHFGDQIEWWDSDTNALFAGEAAELDQANATAAICVFRRIRPPIPTTSGHLFRGIRPPVTRCREAACFGYQP
jgi:putative ATP-dependent endonuclease of OLD family